MTAATIARGLPKARKSGSGWTACCPAHEDKEPSLSISAADGKPLVYCHAGCSQAAVIDALKDLGLWPDAETREERRYISNVYRYTDEQGTLLYEIVRYEPKDFRQRYTDSTGRCIWKKHPRQVLYRLPEVMEAPIVFLVEGERDCETLRDYGFVATTNAGGAKAPWIDSFTETLRGREVIIIPDNDRPGRQRAATIARAIFGHVASLTVLELTDAKDITEWFEHGHSELELIARLEAVHAS